MGQVAKQSILNTLVTYFGIFFGAINTLFLFTHILSEQDYGVVSYILATANMVWPILAFGLHNTLIKFYHNYTDTTTQFRFFTWILLVPVLLLIVVVALYLLLNDLIIEHYSHSNPVVIPYVWVIIAIGFMSAYFELFYAWAKVHLQSVKGNLVKELLHRVLISILLGAVYFEFLSAEYFIYCLAILYTLRTWLMKRIAFKVKKPQFSLGNLPNTKSLISYSALILIAASVTVFLLDLDKLMIENYMNIENVAIYNICVYIAGVAGVPVRAMLQITNPITAKLLVANDSISLNKLNKKSSLTAFIATIWVSLLVVCNVHAIFQMIPPQYELYIEIILLITFIKLFDASLGITNSVLFNSNSYQWVLIIGVAILGIAFYLNTVFIPNHGIVGAVLATFFSYTIYNMAKLIFVYIKFKIQPFSLRTLFVISYALIIWLIFYYWNTTGVMHPIFSIAIKGTAISIAYIMFIYLTKLSPEVNEIINKTLFKSK